MNCKSCQRQLDPKDKLCPYCGVKTQSAANLGSRLKNRISFTDRQINTWTCCLVVFFLFVIVIAALITIGISLQQM